MIRCNYESLPFPIAFRKGVINPERWPHFRIPSIAFLCLIAKVFIVCTRGLSKVESNPGL